MSENQQPSLPKASRPYMPGDGVLPADQGKGLLPWNWAVEHLQAARTYFVSTVQADGQPHTMPVWGAWLDEGFCFITGKHSRKARNLEANPRCTVTVERNEETVVVEGTAAMHSDPDLLQRFKAVYSPKYEWDMQGFEEPIWVVKPHKVFAFIASGDDFAGTATRWIF